MKESRFEPGLLPVFRLFASVRIILTYLATFLWIIAPDSRNGLPMTAFIGSVALLVYLSSKNLREKMGKRFLKLGLLFATIGPILDYALTIMYRIRTGSAGGNLLDDVWMLAVNLFIPLILYSWQYRWRKVLTYVVGTVLTEILLSLPLIFIAGGSLKDIQPVIGLTVVQLLLFLPVSFVVYRLVTAQREQRQALADANMQIARYATTLEQLAVSHERNRMARELHDTLAHTLSGLAVQLEAVKALWDSDETGARELLDKSLDGTRDGLREARRAIGSLRATPLEDMGLALALWNLAESYRARLGIDLDLNIPAQIDNLRPEVEQAVYRIAEEGFANIARHANASVFTFHIFDKDAAIRMTIADDGVGYDPASLPDGHFGVKGMRERAEMVGGNLVIESTPDGGTLIEFFVENAK